MKVAQLLTTSTGGIGRHVASIAPRLERRGHQIRVFCPKVTTEAQLLMSGRWAARVSSLVPTWCTPTD
jgi:glycogen synthase